MPVPRPPVPLTDVCSVIFNNTLYTYSAGAFQSLALEPGAEWKKLPSGVSVTGAACVGSTPVAPREPGFFVVGGKGPADYNGLQKFTYSTGKWESFTPTSGDVKDRVWHGAAYINKTDAILVYAGTQDGSKHSSTQTFTVGASAPYDVLSGAFAGMPPATNPIILPWSDREAALIGGSETNNKVMLFSPEYGWVDSGVSLASPLAKDTSTVLAEIISGDDGSKSLYTFDMSQSPNQVTRTVLINGQKQPVANSKPVAARSIDDADAIDGLLEKRLTSDQWPMYNATNAPKATRTNYAIAQDPNGRVFFAGGNQEDALCVFDGRANRWLEASDLFNAEESVRTTDFTSSSSSTASSATATSSTTSSTTIASSSATSTLSTTSASSTPTGGAPLVGAGTDSSAKPFSSNPPINAILGAVLGTTALVLLLLGILYCLLRRKKKRQEFIEAGHTRRSSGAASIEKGGIGYANDSLYTPTNGVFRGHQQQDSHASFSSMAILMGKANGPKPVTIERHPSKDSKRSSTGSILNAEFKKSISKPIPQTQEANPFADPKPFSPSNPFADPKPFPPSNPFADPSSSTRSPQPRDEKGVAFSRDVAEPRPRGNKPDGPEGPRRSSGWNRYWSGGSTLNILGFGNGASKRTSGASSRYSTSNATTNRITQDSATVPHLNVGALSGPKPEFNRVNSGSPTISHYTPHKEMQGRIERPMSQESGMTGYSSGVPASVHEQWDPTSGSKPWGSVRAPSSAYNSVYSTAPPPMDPDAPRPPLPSGVSTQPQLAMASTSSDMSWLNLGENRRV
ncbi:hypothetical protein MAPG_03209 [Magnaporthiopsis poae ATCC 64411]|uniref:Pre-mRNA splicing factor CLF1 n=1 Tax=Magnaporthiopsis poae (strain ATCC 64411 / 73-15) TaxID=644358 RepID=A0A0C4DTE3_MAGP6|nr:hypothetical protein MAPG_03209 [Magnaporthiopsis poae ATCC 64411]